MIREKPLLFSTNSLWWILDPWNEEGITDNTVVPSFFYRRIMLMETLILIVAMLLVLKNVNWARSSAVGHKNRLMLIAVDNKMYSELDKLTKEQRHHIENVLGFHILVCGVGTDNAARATQWAKTAGCYQACVNIGTAGSHKFPTGALVIPNQTALRDFDCSAIMPIEKHKVPFDDVNRFGAERVDGMFRMIDLTTLVIPDGVKVLVGSDENPITCWTGNNTHAFTEKSDIMDGAVIEMEGDAVVGTYDDDALLIKWISDAGDENVAEEWQANAGGIPWDDVISILNANFSRKV